ncbi:MAG: HDOD domain-containing protein [Polyangiaceae bacterium]|nr:HDOD domain-containing protein [Polyangiaceae bacterium]
MPPTAPDSQRSVPPLERILAEAKRLPTMPAAVLRLFALARDERAGAADVEAAIRPDVTLSASVLRLANSPVYGMVRKVTDLRMAVSLLGSRRLCDVAASAHLLRIATDRLHGYEVAAKAFWTHCSAVALLAEALARRIGAAQGQQVFMCGLLHDIGKIAVSLAWLEQPFELGAPLEGSRADLLAAERVELGTDHAEVGGALLETWRLPAAVCHTARWHHTPELCPEEAQEIAMVVHLANGLAHEMGHGASRSEVSGLFDPKIMGILGLNPHQLERASIEAADVIQAAANLHSGR